jgi:hypothetical protein
MNAISSQLEEAMAVLEQLRITPTEMPDTNEDVALILNGIQKFEFVALLLIRAQVLSSLDWIQKYLQVKKIYIKH